MGGTFYDFLRELAPYMVVVGFLARCVEHDGSDIDVVRPCLSRTL